MSNQGSTSASGRVHVREGFKWDSFGGYIIDIDSTLMRVEGGVHTASFTEAVEQVMGLKLTLEGVSMSGNTDRGILREMFANASIPEPIWQPRLDEILAAMCSIVEQKRALLRPYVLPGVVEFLEHLTAKGAVLGLGTGNLKEIGWLKLEVAGLGKWFQFGGFSDHHELRADVIGHAAQEARRIAGPATSLCVVGDTPRDIAAAVVNNLAVIAVATGHFPFEELMECKPDACTETLVEILGVRN